MPEETQPAPRKRGYQSTEYRTAMVFAAIIGVMYLRGDATSEQLIQSLTAISGLTAIGLGIKTHKNP